MIVKLKRENKIIDKGEESMTRVAQDTDTAEIGASEWWLWCPVLL